MPRDDPPAGDDDRASSHDDRSMADVDWREVYERQAARDHLVPRLADLLGLEAGDRVLEVGCGPGRTTAGLAARVAPGRVVALDRHRAALAFLVGAVEAAPDAVDPVVGDVGTQPLRFDEPVPALAAFVLHHLDDPPRAVDALASALPVGSRLLVAEYDPDAPGDVGPPLAWRPAPGDVLAWLEAAGFAVEAPVDLPDEAYAVVARRGDPVRI